MKIKILYEDKDVLAIDKPAGISVHASAYKGEAKRKAEKFITDWVLENYPKMKKVGEPTQLRIKNDELRIDRPGIVHRLDKETSGVLLLAKNQKFYEYLKQQFQDKKIRKTYIVIVSGFIKNDTGIINKTIGRSPSDFRKRLAGRGAKGVLREAITEFKVIKRFKDKKGNDYSVLEVYPKTGRTHQIRVHMKYFCHPVVCDKLYALNDPCPLGLDRLGLHAKSIEFKNLKGDKIKVEAQLPKEFKKFVK